MTTKCPIIEYFGMGTVERAIADHFNVYGLSEQARDELMEMSTTKQDDFFEMVSNYVMRTEKLS